MNTLYNDSVEKVTLNLYVSGEETDATGTPVLTVKNRVTNTLLSTPTITKTGTGKYYGVIGPPVTEANGQLLLTWSYTLAGNSVVNTESIDVVEPYIEMNEILDIAPAGTTYQQAQAAERYSRHAIDAYCGQRFTSYNDTCYAIGQGHSTLPLTQRVLSISSINVDGLPVYIPGSLTNEIVGVPSVSPTGKGLRLKAAESEWKDGVRYDVTGIFGWTSAPQTITDAARLLVNDFFCKESIWRNRYVESISASDWRIVFSSEAFTGTGNSTVDKILEPYCSLNWMVI